MGLGDMIKFSIKKNMLKGIKGAATALAGLAGSQAVKHFGVPLTVEQQVAVAAGISGVLISLVNWLKVKFPDRLGWL